MNKLICFLFGHKVVEETCLKCQRVFTYKFQAQYLSKRPEDIARIEIDAQNNFWVWPDGKYILKANPYYNMLPGKTLKEAVLKFEQEVEKWK